MNADVAEPTMRVQHRAKISDVGSCNFCHRWDMERRRTVTVVASPGGLSVRFCDDCLRELKQQTKGIR